MDGPSGIAAVQRSAAELTLSGRVLNASTRYSVSNILVQIRYVEPSPEPGASPPMPSLLGSGVSDPTGEFFSSWLPGPAIAAKLCLLANCPDARWIVSAYLDAHDPPLVQLPPSAPSGTTTRLELLVPLPRKKITRAQWSEIGSRADTAAIATLSGLVDRLVGPTATYSTFGDWPISQQQNAVAELECAFLDPHHILEAVAPLPPWQTLAEPGGIDAYERTLGEAARRPEVQAALEGVSQKLAAFPTIASVDWKIEPSLFKRDPGAAITAHEGDYTGTFPKPGPLQRNPNSEIGYRDYLRTQWTSAITTVWYTSVYKGGEEVPLTLSAAQAEEQLRNRFHQDFRTTDTSAASPNEILIPILTEILTAPPGNTFGFGVPAATIPPRGTASARDYLNVLIGLTGISVEELSLRYRTDFSRPDGPASSSTVWENIYTLQAFFRDSFQSVADPAHTDPDVLEQPIIPDKMVGRAPFFLEYDEWLLLQQPVPYENYVQIRNVFYMHLDPDARTELQNWANSPSSYQSVAKFHVAALKINDDLQTAFGALDQNRFRDAIEALYQIWGGVSQLLDDPNVDYDAVITEFTKRRGKKIASMDDLFSPDDGIFTMWQKMGTPTAPIVEVDVSYFGPYYTLPLACALAYLSLFTLPTLIAQASLAIGLYAPAVRLLTRAAWHLVGASELGLGGGWSPRGDEPVNPTIPSDYLLYIAGDLPYTFETDEAGAYLSFSIDDSKYGPTIPENTEYKLSEALIPTSLHAVERVYFRLQMGNAMLAWADTLYRINDSSSIARARELYKGIYFLHGATPDIDPGWAKNPPWHLWPGYVNPALSSQLARAVLGFTQIAAGLNFFGYANNVVPIQRYSTLISAANAFATDAKSAQTDFLNAMAQIEAATIDSMKNTAMLRRAQLGIQIAQQQSAIANDQVTQANVLIAQVNQQIDKAKKDIEDHNSFFGQLGDYLSGMGSIAKSAKDVADLGEAGKSIVDKPSVSEALGFYGDESSNALAIGGGSTVLGAYAAFGVASYVTLSSMADAANQRDQQLHALQTQNLVAANAQLDIAQHQVTIAQLQQKIAQADADLAQNLLDFAQERYLNVEFWSYLATLFQRALRRYLDYGARAGWLAQRALSYEQNAPINIVGFDYYPAQYLGAGGADELQLDLASLEAQHLAGLQEMVPLKVTFSLARDFPLPFAQLKRTGSCQFATSDAALQAAYPGMYGFRVRAVTPRIVRSNAGAPMRGVFANAGASQISLADGSLKPSIRPADALPISEFDIGTLDMNVFGLPGGTLMQFEGSGIDTIWGLILPPAANPGGLGALGDVVITFNLTTGFSPALFQTVTGTPLTDAMKMVMVSAFQQRLPGLSDLQKKGTADFTFDFGTLDLPAVEKTRKLNNIFVVLAGPPTGSKISVSVKTKSPAKSLKIDLADGIAYSNMPPITDALSSVPASPLNALAGFDLNQSFTVHIAKTDNPGIDLGTISDVLLGADYTATY